MTPAEAKVAQQIALEEEMRNGGIARYRKSVAKARENKAESSTSPGTTLLNAALVSTADAVQAFFAEANSGKPGRRHVAYGLIKSLEPEVVAYITAQVAIDNLAQQKTFTSAALEVGRKLYDEITFRAFKCPEAEAVGGHHEAPARKTWRAPTCTQSISP
jgi:DNA-directed RNA polymerase